MPCPLFEPLRKVSDAGASRARLPLIFEFEGLCHGGDQSIDPEHRLRYCNHGYAKGHCQSLPADVPISAVRFDVTERTASALSVLVMEEENHWPRAWSRFEYLIQDDRLVPDIADICRRAQVFQFCRSYLEKV